MNERTFRNRQEAGQLLAAALEGKLRHEDIVLAIPRGGAAVGLEVARAFGCAFALVVARKLPSPGNPEFGFGAVAEDGSTFMLDAYAATLPPEDVERIIEEQRREIKRRIDALRGGEALPPLAGRTVCIVDDGIAMGSTMRASIELCRNAKARRVIAAAPVADADVAEDLRALADDVVILTTPRLFRAVAQVYEDWYDVPDHEVRAIMQDYRASRPVEKRP